MESRSPGTMARNRKGTRKREARLQKRLMIVMGALYGAFLITLLLLPMTPLQKRVLWFGMIALAVLLATSVWAFLRLSHPRKKEAPHVSRLGLIDRRMPPSPGQLDLSHPARRANPENL